MAGYLIVQIDVEDADTYEEYKVQVPPIIEKFGGEYLVRGGAMEVVEGEWTWPRLVVVRFPSVDQAKAFHSSVDYEGVKALRQSASKGNAVIVEGI